MKVKGENDEGVLDERDRYLDALKVEACRLYESEVDFYNEKRAAEKLIYVLGGWVGIKFRVTRAEDGTLTAEEVIE